MNLLDLKLIFLDLQTTGASPANGAPLEVAWALGSARDGQPRLTQKFVLKQPDNQAVPKRIQAVTGITDGDMENAVKWKDANAILHLALGQAELPGFVIHYAQFEKPFLRSLLKNFDEQYSLACTHQIATRIFPNLPSRGIRGLAGYFGFPLEECKRAETHVTATFEIWKHLCELLKQQEITTWDELQNWLNTAPKAKRTKYDYPLERGIRLAMPDCPGIYKMLSCKGDVLYVGKATSLKDRVNSYFRGKKHRDPKKLEMLTQAWDIKVETCPTVLEACLLEVKEIKRLSPPYNIALKTGIRPLLFYSADFSSCSIKQDHEHPVGPFRNEFVLDGFIRFVNSLSGSESRKAAPALPSPTSWDQLIFFEEIDPQIIEAGFELFLSSTAQTRETLLRPRSALALGAWFYREYRRQQAAADAEDEDEIEDAEVAEAEPEEERPPTPEEVAIKFAKLLRRAAHAYLLSRRLTRLLNARVTFTESGVERTLAFDNTVEKGIFPWENADIETFDVLRVLHTELNRLKKNGEQVAIAEAS